MYNKREMLIYNNFMSLSWAIISTRVNIGIFVYTSGFYTMVQFQHCAFILRTSSKIITADKVFEENIDFGVY